MFLSEIEKDTRRHTEMKPVKTEAEIGVLLPQTKERAQPAEAGRGKKYSPLAP